jgi:hypothetical protein
MTPNDAFVLFFAGITVFAALAVLLARRLVVSAFSLGLMFQQSLHSQRHSV